jgi:hypothetical protein
VLGEHRLGQVHLPDGDAGGGERVLARGVAHRHADLLVGRGDPAEAVDEVHVPGGAAELAVGGRRQPDLLLQGHRVADRGVLDRAQAGVVERPGGVPGPGVDQRGWAEQAADVVGTERGVHGR